MLGYHEEGLEQYRKNESQFLQWLGRAKDNITIEGEDKIVATIDTGYSSYLVNFSELSQLPQTDPQRAAAFYHETVLPSFESVRDACIRLREINSETMFKASARARHVAGRGIWSMATISAAALAIAVGFSLLLSNLITRPLRQIMQAVQEVAEGNYDIEVSTGSSDEFGHLAREFSAMVRKLKSYRDLNLGRILAEKGKSEAVIGSIDDGIVVVDAEFKVTDVNRAATQALGIDPADAQERHFLEVVKSEELFNYVKDAAQSGKPPQVGEGKDIFTVQQGEAQRHYQFSVAPVHAMGGSMVGVVLVLRDVTKLKEVDRLKSEFVMTASHELRTPLTSMGMSVDLVLESAMEKLNEKERELLSAAQEDLQRLKALVNDLLDLSKIEAGKMEMEFDRVAVGTLFEKATAVLKTQADEQSVDLSSDIEEGVPEVKADANKITWVLTNLISNALRYTDSGGHIRVCAQRVGPHVHVSVSDDGGGIPYEAQGRIFEKFVQVTGQRDAKGSGLGLALCKEIVRAHRGTIWVDSTPGEGSTFTFTLPVAE
jgi:NtrC-family two-component system sensor histidine kinase KinB